MYWKSDEWPLHVRLRIVRAIMIPYFLYFLPLLDWWESHMRMLNSLLLQFLWNKHSPKSMVLISWDSVFQPKIWGGRGIIHALTHMHARRATMMKHMFDKSTTWSHSLCEIIQQGTVYYHGLWDLDVSTKLFSHAPLRVRGRTSSSLIASWLLTCGALIWSGRMRYTGNSLPDENVF